MTTPTTGSPLLDRIAALYEPGEIESIEVMGQDVLIRLTAGYSVRLIDDGGAALAAKADWLEREAEAKRSAERLAA